MRTRLRNIVRRMCQGEAFFSQASPKMTVKEYRELWDLGYHINSSSAHGADTSAGRIYVRLWPDRFLAKAIEDGTVAPGQP